MSLLSKKSVLPLGDGLKIIVSKEHSFNTDSLLLAHFASGIRAKRKLDMCSGCGIIPIMLTKKKDNPEITAVEIQKDAAEMFKCSVLLNKLQKVITVLHEDINNLLTILPLGSFDLISCNPPYKPEGTGITSSSPSKKTARHQTQCTMQDVFRVASKLLRFSGSLCFCQRPEYLSSIIKTMSLYKLETKRIQLVQSKSLKEPKLMLIEAKLGAKQGLRFMPLLLMEDDNGKCSNQMREVYGSYFNEKES